MRRRRDGPSRSRTALALEQRPICACSCECGFRVYECGFRVYSHVYSTVCGSCEAEHHRSPVELPRASTEARPERNLAAVR